jgi:hypothetical protein
MARMTTQTEKPPGNQTLLGILFPLDRAVEETETAVINAHRSKIRTVHRPILVALKQLQRAKRRLLRLLARKTPGKRGRPKGSLGKIWPKVARTCQHCLRPYERRAGRGLCWACYLNLDIRKQYSKVAPFGGKAASQMQNREHLTIENS